MILDGRLSIDNSRWTILNDERKDLRLQPGQGQRLQQDGHSTHLKAQRAHRPDHQKNPTPRTVIVENDEVDSGGGMIKNWPKLWNFYKGQRLHLTPTLPHFLLFLSTLRNHNKNFSSLKLSRIAAIVRNAKRTMPSLLPIVQVWNQTAVSISSSRQVRQTSELLKG